MNIKITPSRHRDFKYMADLVDLPGSPPVGYGNTVAEATANMFINLLADKRSGWMSMIDLTKPAKIKRIKS